VNVDGEEPNYSVVDFGYIGVKGRKQWLFNDNDVDEMSVKHRGRRSIQLWAYSHVKVSGKKGESSCDTQRRR
jgi:hypothetical protein